MEEYVKIEEEGKEEHGVLMSEYEKWEALLNEAIGYKNKGNEIFKSAKNPEDFETIRKAREEYYSASKILIQRRQEFSSDPEQLVRY